MIPMFLFIAISVLSTALLWFMPSLTRPGLYFAITVKPTFRNAPDGQSIVSRYRVELLVTSALTIVAAMAAIWWLGVGFIPAALFIQLAGSFLVFCRARNRVSAYSTPPSTIREAELHRRDRIIPGGWVAVLAPYALLAGCAIYLRTHWGDIPTNLPVHWGIGGQPDRWATLSLATAFSPLVSATGVLVVLTIILYGIAYWARFVNISGAQGLRELKFRRTFSAVLLALEYLVATQSCWAELSMLGHNANASVARLVIPLLPLFLLIFAVVMLAWLGQGGTRKGARQETLDDPVVPVGDRMEDKYWILGVFYINRDDPAVFIEKRFGLGYTLNLARPATWIIGFVVAFVLAIPLLVAHIHR
jgi:uncharacterized membrane protein